MRFYTTLFLSLTLASVAAKAPPPSGAVDPTLLSTASRDTLRERLLALAAKGPPPIASRALFFRGMSFEHAAMADSAIACYRRAAAVDRNPAATSALIDVLLRRRAEGEVAEATALLEKLQEAEQESEVYSTHSDPARLGWAYVLSGQAKRGLELLAPQEARLRSDPVWAYRFARAYFDAGKSNPAFTHLIGLNTAARGEDREVVSMLEHIEKSLGPNARIRERTIEAMQHHDDAENALLQRLGGRRIRLFASDGAYLGGAVFADSAAKRRARAAVLLAGLGDELSAYDSLTAALRASGFAVFVLDPRGSGWSVAPEFSLPDTWLGREDALSARVARDVHDAIRAFPKAALIDTTRVLLVGVSAMAPIAVEAAAADPRVTALALLDPWTSPVDRGATLAAARRIRAPAYIHVGPSGRSEAAFNDVLFHALPQRTSRIVESTAPQPGAAAFGSRPDVTPRFVRWLAEAYAAKSSSRATPPARPHSR
jgi:alpha-beta hydrolase superfamily lysophospholipase